MKLFKKGKLRSVPRIGPKGDFTICKLPPSPSSTLAKTYDMIIKVGNDVSIGVDIKAKRSKDLNLEALTQKVSQAFHTAFPDAEIKLERH